MYNYSIRLMLFVILIQFLSPALESQLSTLSFSKSTIIHTGSSQPLSFAVLSDENKAERENEDDKINHAFPILDLRKAVTFLNKMHASFTCIMPDNTRADLPMPRFKFLRVFLI
jgi:hypothetical protein